MAYFIGVLGIIANMLIYQQKSGKKLILYKLISDILWALHYALLSAYSGAAIAVIGIFREIVFYNQDKKWAKSKLWLVFFLLCSVVSAAITWKSAYSILPAFASVLSVIGFWRANPRLSRGLSFPISFAMLTYDVTCNSYTGIVNEIFTLISSVIGIIRYSKRSQKNEKA